MDDFSDDPEVQTSDTEDDWSSDPATPVAEIDGNATTFADAGDLARYRYAISAGASENEALKVGDNGKGAAKLGSIDTPNAYGVAVPEEYLRAAFGEDQAAWRRARAEVTSNGQTRRVPFVDLGPGLGPQAKGVVTDLTNPLATVLGSNGLAKTHVKFIPESGPDYLQDPQAWMAEQAKLGPQPDDFSSDPPVQQKADDFSSDPEIKPAETPAQPAATPAPNPLLQFGQQVAGSARQTLAEQEKGLSESELKHPIPASWYPFLPPEEQEARRAADIAAAQKNLPAQTAEVTASKSAQDAAYGKTIPGKIASTIGGIAPYVAQGAVGGPIVGAMDAAANMGAQAYSQVYDDSFMKFQAQGIPTQEAGKKAAALADDASRVSEVVGAALSASGIKIPIQSLIPRIAARVALTGSVQGAAAGIMQELDDEGYTKAGLQPTGNVGQAAAQGAVLGGVLGGIHGVAEGGEKAPEGRTMASPQEPMNATQPEAKPEQIAPQPLGNPAEGYRPSTVLDQMNALQQAEALKSTRRAMNQPEPERPIESAIAQLRAPELGGQPEELSPAESDAQARNDALYQSLKAETGTEAPAVPRSQPDIGTEFHAGIPIPKIDTKAAGDLAGGIAKASQDFMTDYQETKPLGLQLRREPSFEQRNAALGQVPDLTRYLDDLKGTTRDTVIRESDAYFRALDGKRQLPFVSPATQRYLDLVRPALNYMGDKAVALGIKVQQSDGQWRDFRKIGDSYVPRGFLKADTQDIFDNKNGTRKADYQAIIAKNPQAAAFFNSTPEKTSSANFANLYKAREANLPLSFYDYSPYAILRYLNRATKALAQAEAYGQPVGKVPDLFDRIVQDIEQSSRPKTQRDFLIGRVRSAQNAEYNNYDRGGFQGPLRSLTHITTASMVGNPLSSMKYLVTGTLQNLHYGGSSAFARAIGQLIKLRGGAYREMENMGIARNVLSQVMRSYDDKEPNFGDWTSQQMLHYMGHNAADSTNRMLSMLIAKAKLEDFNKNPAANSFLGQMIRRRGITDLAALHAENGKGPLSDEFIRQFALDVHGSYGLGQMPSWMGNPQSRVFMQFMRWGINASRLANQEHTMPFVKAVAAKDPGAVGYQLLRGLGFAVAAVGSGEITNLFRSTMTGRDPNDPSNEEIGNAVLKGNYGNAFAWGLKRMIDMAILGGFTGTLGEYYGQAGNVVTQPGQMGAKNPMHPPGYDLLTNGLAFIQGWYGENKFLGAPSKKLLTNLLDNISAARVARQVTSNIGAKFGIQPAKEYAAKNELAWIREREDMFAKADPRYAAKLAQKGNLADQSSGRTPFMPVHEEIQGALLTGNSNAAVTATRQYLQGFPAGQRAAKLKALQESIRESQPLKPGGSISATSQADLFRWARANLPAGDVSRMKALANTYARTANRTGFFSLREQP